MVLSTMDYAAAIWDPHEKTKTALLERVQNRAARWARRERGREAATVSSLHKILGWTTLEERRRRQRLTLVWRVLKGELDVVPAEVGLVPAAHLNRGPDPNSWKQTSPHGADKCSPLWRATSTRTIEDFNKLPGKLVTEATDAGTFSKGLAAAMACP